MVDILLDRDVRLYELHDYFQRYLFLEATVAEMGSDNPGGGLRMIRIGHGSHKEQRNEQRKTTGK
jgi:hypothetical protein